MNELLKTGIYPFMPAMGIFIKRKEILFSAVYLYYIDFPFDFLRILVRFS